ncbi:penicillin-binding protein 2 [Sneathiella sp. P13V-1]|uniref:peptidoglycan D,D-transpeptidase FtsI family protein n=1 Tax=Sneathiella sp. P13V-1 TaxID=2697366 RepID=UPI00187B61E4|nr:penicillin-binding protein 2 [Sneathiella sp. P13V-1]MBE7636679.1 penicillin-binding protein 2 [Sneathiella sp. P13V-1]
MKRQSSVQIKVVDQPVVARVGLKPKKQGAFLHLEGSAKETLEQGRNRLVVAGVLFAFCFVVLAGRLVGLAISGSENELAQENVQTQSVATAQTLDKRAPIYDRNGNLLAVTLDAVSLFADPRKIMDADEAAKKLTSVLTDLEPAALKAKLSLRRNFVWVKRHLTPQQQKSVNDLGIPGLFFRNEERRVYPVGNLAAHLVGYTDIDGKGIAGIERYFDERLKGVNSTDTGPVQLSIDTRIQYALRDELSRSMSIFRAIGASGMVMDVKTGEVLGMVSLPDFDPNRPNDYPKDNKFNKVTLGVYEMGSTFKTFTTAMALDLKSVSLRSGYDATNPIRIAGFRIRDDHPKKRWLSVPEIFMYSSNIGTAKMADAIGPKRQKAFLKKIGLLDRPIIELPEVGAPILPPRWNTLETMTISYGHGLSVSPLQLGTAISSMVNGGVFRNPTVIKQDAEVDVEGRRVIREETSDTVRRLMRLVVKSGTGKNADAKGYLVGGKTGTAEKAVNGRYKRDALVTSFVSAFPMHDPRYVVLAMLDEPKGNASTHGFRSAGWTTAPIVSRLVARVAPLLGVQPEDEESKSIQKALHIPVYSREKKNASF